MARENAVSKYMAMIGRKGGKASGKSRMENLTHEQRVAIAKTAAAARWAKPVTQADLQRQSALQVAEWTADRDAQLGAQDISARLEDGAPLKPGKLTFDKRLKMVKTKDTVSKPSGSAIAQKELRPARPLARKASNRN